MRYRRYRPKKFGLSNSSPESGLSKRQLGSEAGTLDERENKVR
jgi:hypothetical protein